MWKKISARPAVLGLLSGLACVLAFAPIEITSVLVFCPLLLILSIEHCRSWKQAFAAGFLASAVIMLGGFYWVVYTIHIFGSLPWSISTLLYLMFAGLGALNFPLFTASLYGLHRRRPSLRKNVGWYAVGIPALFTVFEFAIPKLFPWYVGHTYYRAAWLTQVVEFTGCTFLTFLIFSWGGVGAAALRQLPHNLVKRWAAVPLVLTLVSVAFSAWRLSTPFPTAQTKRVALIQANIGSLDKVQARSGFHEKVQYTIGRYLELTAKVLPEKPSLILWPETAMPFGLEKDEHYSALVRREISGWNVPLITGGYSPSERPYVEYNAAFLLEPQKAGFLKTTIYRKNILLAFGEYFPGGTWFPKLYQWFPAVSHFERGKDQQIFTLEDGTRLGTTICYEAIVPSFYRKVTRQGVQAVINLTNDSWFGPTSEPRQHAALATFRAIETRTPLIRVTNTGTSFAVDRLGKMSETTPVYDEAAVTVDVAIPPQAVITLYTKWGDWFIGVLMVLVVLFVRGAPNVPVPVRK